MTITTPGTVIDGKIINGPLVIAAPDVVIKNSSLKFHSTWGIDAENGHNVTIQNCDIVGPGSSGDSNSAILGSGNFIGNNISQVENGITLTSGASTVKGNFIHDLNDSGSDPHYDGISVQGGQDGVLIEGNTVVSRDTSDVFIKNDFGKINDVSVHHNLLMGDPGYNVYVDGRANGGAITGVSISDNYVQKGFYGTYSVDNSNPSISGNVEFNKGETPTAHTGSDTAPTTPTTSTGSHDPAPSTGTSGSDQHTSTGTGNSDGHQASSGTGDTTGSHDPAPSTGTSGSDQHTSTDAGNSGDQQASSGTGDTTGSHDPAPSTGTSGSDQHTSTGTGNSGGHQASSGHGSSHGGHHHWGSGTTGGNHHHSASNANTSGNSHQTASNDGTSANGQQHTAPDAGTTTAGQQHTAPDAGTTTAGQQHTSSGTDNAADSQHNASDTGTTADTGQQTASNANSSDNAGQQGDTATDTSANHHQWSDSFHFGQGGQNGKLSDWIDQVTRAASNAHASHGDSSANDSHSSFVDALVHEAQQHHSWAQDHHWGDHFTL